MCIAFLMTEWCLCTMSIVYRLWSLTLRIHLYPVLRKLRCASDFMIQKWIYIWAIRSHKSDKMSSKTSFQYAELSCWKKTSRFFADNQQQLLKRSSSLLLLTFCLNQRRYVQSSSDTTKLLNVTCISYALTWTWTCWFFVIADVAK